VVCHHVRTVTVSGPIRLEQPEVMVGCNGVQRLFVLAGTVGGDPGLSNVIYRIDPVSGFSDNAWLVDRESEALSVAGDDQLLLAMHDRIEQYDTDGRQVRVVATGLEPGQSLHEALLLPDSMIAYSLGLLLYIVKRWPQKRHFDSRIHMKLPFFCEMSKKGMCQFSVVVQANVELGYYGRVYPWTHYASPLPNVERPPTSNPSYVKQSSGVLAKVIRLNYNALIFIDAYGIRKYILSSIK